MPSCPNCGEETPERARFCPVCGVALTEVPTAQGLRKVVTIVFCDLVGSTPLGERLDPETLRQVIASYFEAMAEALKRHEGAIEKFIGDAVMAVFGTPTVREDDALRAVRAAAEMRSALAELNDRLEQRWGVRLEARTGVNTGEVITGDPKRGEGFVSGDAVNVAARLEQAAPPGEIYLGEGTLELVRDAVTVEAVPPLDLKGKSEPVPAYRLVEVADETTQPGRRLGSPLIGRERELELLRDAYDRAASGRTCELVTLVGPAGIGKSRLAEEFGASLGTNAKVVAGRCLSYGEGLTFWPLRAIVHQLVGSADDETLAEAQARMTAVVQDDEDAATIVERVGGALGQSETAAYPTETFWAIRKLLEAGARERPLVILIEDIHWAEPTLLDLIEHLAGEIRDVPVLLIAAARTDLFDVRPDFAGAVEGSVRLDLHALSAEDGRRLVEHLVGDPGAAADLPDRVFAAAEGNPLFVEELVRMVLDERQLDVPPTIHALLAARLDRLEPPERATLEAASVVGRSFSGGAVHELGRGGDREELEERLSALIRKQLIEPDGGRFAGEGTYSFTHILVRDVAYQGILKGKRSELHARVADWLEQVAGERVNEYEEILGYHLERAHRYLTELGPIDDQGRELAGRAAARLGSSGGRALARGDIGPAVSLLERAVSLLDEEDPARRDLTVKLGIALAESGQLSRADAILHDRIESERRGSAYVVFQDGGGKQQVITLDDGGTVNVGRRAENDLALSWDQEVSREHAQLLRSDEGWVLVDVGSRNGSYLNGERIGGRQPLRDGDVLRFGDTVVLFRAPAGEQRPQVSLAPDQVTYMGTRPPPPPQG